MRTAKIDSNDRVVEILDVDAATKIEGFTLIESETATLGQVWDSGAGVFHDPPASPPDPVRTAVVDGGGHVVNIIAAPPGFAIDGMTLVASLTAAIGDHYDGATFTSPPPPSSIPPSLSARQLRLALSQLGHLAAVNAAVAGASADLQIDWEYATSFPRNDPRLIGMGTAAGLSTDDIDAVYLLGITL